MVKVYYSMTDFQGKITFDVGEFSSRASAEGWAAVMTRVYSDRFGKFELLDIVEVR